MDRSYDEFDFVNDSAAQLTLCLFSLAIFFSYALQFYVVMEILGPVLRQRVPDRWYTLTDYLVRFGINLFTCKQLF